MGGSERKTVKVVNALSQSGRNVHLAYLDTEHTLRSGLSDRVPVICLERRGRISFRAARALRTYVLRFGITRIVCMNLYPLLYGHIVRSVLRGRKPSLVLMINTTEHASARAERLMAVYRPLMRRTQKIVFGCAAQRDIWMQRYRLDGDKCDVIYNGVDSARFSPDATKAASDQMRRELEIRDDDFVVGTVGQLRPVNNQAELIAAIARIRHSVPNVRLVIAGDGPNRAGLEALAKASGLADRIQFLGEIADVRPVLQVLNVFVLPSISETFSNAALEAMSMGTAVILTDTGGAREMVTHGVEGFLYRPGDVDTLGSLLVRLSREPEMQRNLGTHAREAVLEKFSAKRMFDDYESRVIV